MARKSAKTARTKLPASAKRPRTVFHVVPRGTGWAAEVGGQVVCVLRSKGSRVSAFVRLCRELHEVHGVLCQLVIHGRDGVIQREYTYGEDPRETKG